MSADRERCPECGSFFHGRKTRMGDPLPADLVAAQRRILDLEQKNKALGQVNVVQAKRLLALAETIHESSHDLPAPRQRREA